MSGEIDHGEGKRPGNQLLFLPGRHAQTDKLSGWACTACPVSLCSEGGESDVCKSLFTPHPQHVRCRSRCCEGCGCGLLFWDPWAHGEGKAQNSGNPQPPQFWCGGGEYPARMLETQRVFARLPAGTGLEWLRGWIGWFCFLKAQFTSSSQSEASQTDIAIKL